VRPTKGRSVGEFVFLTSYILYSFGISFTQAYVRPAWPQPSSET
jgi:hypothetical protein